jgi:hypothetical protein
MSHTSLLTSIVVTGAPPVVIALLLGALGLGAKRNTPDTRSRGAYTMLMRKPLASWILRPPGLPMAPLLK